MTPEADAPGLPRDGGRAAVPRGDKEIAAAPLPADVRGGDRVPMRFLSVDDSPSARRVFQGVLVGLGVAAEDIRLAADAPEGLRAAADWRPDVVFLDMELSGGNGTASTADGAGAPNGDALGRALLRRSPRPKIVVVTALDRDDPRVRSLLKDGAIDVIMKPVRAERVREVLQRIGFAPSAPPPR